MKGFVEDIEGLATRNDEFRKVLYSAKNCQLVLMALKLYALYAPSNHRDRVVRHTRADAEADGEHFVGKTTE
jgi:hypothetical protein